MSGRSFLIGPKWGRKPRMFIYNIAVCPFLPSAELEQVDLVSAPRIGPIILSAYLGLPTQ